MSATDMSPPSHDTVGVAHAERDVRALVALGRVHLGAELRIARADAQHDARVLLPKLVLAEAVQRALLVDLVHQRERQRKEREIAALELQVHAAPVHLAVLVELDQQHVDAGDRVVHRVGAAVAEAHHQRPPGPVAGDHHLVGEQDLGLRAREAHEGEAGHRRGEHHADEDLERRHEVPGQRGRCHDAVADGGERLDAEEERVEERARRHVGDAARQLEVRQREREVDGSVQHDQHGEELGPREREREVVRVAEVPARDAPLLEDHRAGARGDGGSDPGGHGGGVPVDRAWARI